MDKVFDFSDLSEFSKDCLNLAKEMYPKQVKKFLKDEGKKQTKLAKSMAKKAFKTKTGNYLKGFKTGKVYKYDGDDCVRTYNSMPHAHLLEFGHEIVPRGKKGQSNKGGSSIGKAQGKEVLKETNEKFQETFYKDVEDFVGDFLDKGLDK